MGTRGDIERVKKLIAQENAKGAPNPEYIKKLVRTMMLLSIGLDNSNGNQSFKLKP